MGNPSLPSSLFPWTAGLWLRCNRGKSGMCKVGTVLKREKLTVSYRPLVSLLCLPQTPSLVWGGGWDEKKQTFLSRS